jgi:hypothetical protein
MKLCESKGTLKRFHRTPWRFQQTFRTAPKDLPPFVTAIVSALQPIQAARVTIDRVVFKPRNLTCLLAKYSIETDYTHDLSVEATGQAEIEDLLQGILSDWVDFIFVPTPKRFVIYADHDEYTTFFSVTKSHLNRVVRALAGQGFLQVQDYQRRL